MRTTVLALAALVAATATATASFGDEPLAGQWIAISAEENGAAAEDRIGERITFDGDAFRVVDIEGREVSSGTFATDPAATPATIDFTVTTPPGAAWAGIWKRDGSLLTLVENAPDPAKPRPEVFAAPVGSGHAMIVLTPWE